METKNLQELLKQLAQERTKAVELKEKKDNEEIFKDYKFGMSIEKLYIYFCYNFSSDAKGISFVINVYDGYINRTIYRENDFFKTQTLYDCEIKNS